jgi:hypothetical protein
MNLYINIIILGILFYIADITSSKYEEYNVDIYFYFFLLLHHIIKSYILLGWISNNKKHLIIYIIFVIFVMFHWYFNDDKCVFTEYIKDKCKNKNYIFKDIVYYTGEKNKSLDIYYYIVYCLFVVYAFYKIKKL